MEDVDVVIAGAGPAGVAVAVALARRAPELVRGGRVVCFDKARFPREKPCGGGLTGHARTALDALGLALRVPHVACSTGQVVFGAHARRVSLGRPVDVVRREEFDADLVAQARALGVRVIEGEGVADHTVDRAAGRVAVATTRGNTLRARVLVAADGAGSRVRKQLVRGPGAPELGANGDRPGGGLMGGNPARALRLFKLELPAPRPFPPEMIYDFSAMDEGLRGYVWLFPVPGDRLNVGVMHYPSTRLGGAALTDLLARALRRHGVELPRAPRGWPAWSYAPSTPIAAPHVLCVGDAAGIDALTGEGIGVGLEHGPLAARAITDALGSGDFTFVDYARVVARAVVGRELALDRHLAALLYSRRAYRYWMSLVMFDRRVLELYAARVCGSDVLADRKVALGSALLRHVVGGWARTARLGRATLGASSREDAAARDAAFG